MTTRRIFAAALAAMALGAWPALAAAQATSVEGLWNAIDDHTGKPRAVVRVFDRGGLLYGRVERLLDPADAGRHCNNCSGDRSGQPVLGLEVLRGMAMDDGEWQGGTILDPSTGKVYRCHMRLSDGGRILHVRGFIGISLIGRSQIWERIAADPA
jgi:uncharacterized protein (DUF2147 family)